jgi:hypothetical protein
MNAPLAKTSRWALQGGADTKEQLRQLAADKREVKSELRQVLERLAAKWGISHKDITYAIDGYADDMLSDLVHGVERDLEHAAEEEAPLGVAGP